MSRTGGELTIGQLADGVIRSHVDLNDNVTAPPLHSDAVLFVPTRWHGIIAIDLQARTWIWSVPLDEWATGLAIARDRLVVATSRGVRVLDIDTGKTLWSQAITGQVTTDIAAGGRFICFGTADGAMHVLDAANGASRSIIALDRPPRGHIAIEGEVAYVCAGAATGVIELPLYAIDLADGRLRWRYTPTDLSLVLGDEKTSGPVVGDGLACFSFGERLYAVDVRTGAGRWHFRPVPESEFDWRHVSSQEPFVGAPTFRNGIAYVAGLDRISALDVDSGRELWRYQAGAGEAPGSVTGIPPTLRGNVIFCPLGQSTFHAVRLDPNRPKAPGLSSKQVPIRFPGMVWTSASGAVLLAVVVMLRRRWRSMIVLLCAILGGATLWAWATSYTTTQFVGQMKRSGTGPHAALLTRGVTSRDGSLTFAARQTIWDATITRPVLGNSTAEGWWTSQPHADGPESLLDAPADLGMTRFAATRRSHPSGTSLGPQFETSLTMPHWLAAMLLAIAPLARLLGFWRDRPKFARGRCPECGYDLRASADRCPECGQAVSGKHKK
jgi:outer membrane protein assembly factor BamB